MCRDLVAKKHRELMPLGGCKASGHELQGLSFLFGRPVESSWYDAGCACLHCVTARFGVNLMRRRMLLGDLSKEQQNLIRYSALGWWPEALSVPPLSADQIEGKDEKVPKTDFWMLISGRYRTKKAKKKRMTIEEAARELDPATINDMLNDMQFTAVNPRPAPRQGGQVTARPRNRNPFRENRLRNQTVEVDDPSTYAWEHKWGRASLDYGVQWDASKSIKTLIKEYFDYLSSCPMCQGKVDPYKRALVTDGHGRHVYRLCDKCVSKGEHLYACQFCDESYMPNHLLDYKDFVNREARYTCNYCSKDAKYCERCDNYYITPNCPDCDRAQGLHRHNYTPRFYPLTLPGELKDYTKLMTGMELEMGSPHNHDAHSIARVINGIEGMYCVHDGSITRENQDLRVGVELVTMPFSQQYWHEMLKPRLENLLADLKSKYELEAAPHFSCGMHVHLSRAAFTPARLYKLIYLLTKNSSWTYKIGQRDEDNWTERYCSFNKEAKTNKDLIDKACGYPGDPLPPLVDHRFGGGDGNPHKYVAINTVDNKSIELRMFKGTMNMRAIEKNLEFAWAVFDWAGMASNSELNIPHFLEFIKARSKVYPHLFEYLRALRQFPGMKGDSFIPLYQGD